MSLEVKGVAVRFDDVDILSDVTFSVDSGERFAIMGPSGAGKSTLLRTIAGLTATDSGDISIDGLDVRDVPAHKRSVGMMFQNYALFPHMSVLENIIYGLRVTGMASGPRIERGLALLDLVGLANFSDRSPETLSGGEQQRVALARTLAPSPSVVLLDEPLGSLDESLKFALLAEMKTTLDAVGATSIYVTHDPMEAFAFCDRMAIIDKGSVIRIGRPEEIWSDPRSEFVARSVGHVNIVPWSLLGSNETGVCCIPVDAVTPQSDGRLRGTVEQVTFGDGHYTASVRVAGTRHVLNVRVPESPTLGTQLSLDVDLDAVIGLSAD